MLEYECEHMKVVARRWREKRLQSELSKREFEKYARKTLLQYGWTEDNVEQMMKIINKD